MTIEVTLQQQQESQPTAATPRARWLPSLFSAAVLLALVSGVAAWAEAGYSISADGTVRAISITDLDVSPGTGDIVQIDSGPFITRAHTWTAYWAYYCNMPGVTQWRMAVRLVPLGRVSASSSHVLYAANNSTGPVSYWEIFSEHGAGSYRLVVTATRGCVWSLRAPPVAKQNGAAIDEGTPQYDGGR